MAEQRRSLSNKLNENTVINQENIVRAPKKNCEECKAHEEYIKVLKNALKEVLDQNEALRARVAELEALISQSEDEIGEKNNLIDQLKATLKLIEEQNSKKNLLSEEIKKNNDT